LHGIEEPRALSANGNARTSPRQSGSADQTRSLRMDQRSRMLVKLMAEYAWGQVNRPARC
jgi:hypothetical protein